MLPLDYINKIIFFEKKVFLSILILIGIIFIAFPNQIAARSALKEEDLNFSYKEICFLRQDRLDYPKLLTLMKNISNNNPAKMYILAMNLELNNDHSAQEMIDLLEKSAQKGCGNAKIELWYRYATGKGVAQNNSLATMWAKNALDNNYGSAQIGRWFMYISGAEQEDLPEWDRLVDYDDTPEVLYHLGFMYATGLGIKQNYLSASKWYERAAKKGYPQAQYNLGILYALGKGVASDNVKAYALMDLATENGCEQAETLRDILEKTLNNYQIKSADNISSNFVLKE